MDQDTKVKDWGATPGASGMVFRVTAPRTRRGAIIGSFDEWEGDHHLLQAEEHSDWHANVAEAYIGDPYNFLLGTEEGEIQPVDPYVGIGACSVLIFSR